MIRKGNQKLQVIKLSSDNYALWRDQIEELFNSSVRINFPDAELDDSYGRDKCEEVARFLENGSAIVFAAIEGEKLAGWVWCHQIHRLDGFRIHIAEITVADKWHRQGVGGRLLERVEQYAAENGYREIDLFATASNQSAVKFYQKADYKPERYLMKKIVRNGENIDA